MSQATFLLLTPDFKPLTGGIAEYLHQLWQNIAQSYPAMVISSVPVSETWEHDYTLQVIPSDSTPRNPSLEMLRIKKRTAFLKGMIAELSDNLQVFIGVWNVETHFWCELLQNLEIPYSVFAYGLELFSPVYNRFQNWREKDLKQAKAIYGVSLPTCQLVETIVGEETPVHVAYPGVNAISNYEAIISLAKDLREQFHLQDQLVLLTVARLIPRKGVDFVLKSLPKLLAEFPHVHYFIIGSGKEKEALQKLTQSLQLNQVYFMGQVDELTKQAFYELCDLFVMPNRTLAQTDWEGFGIVFLEAALAGKPSIGGDNGGVKDAVMADVTGLLVDTSEAEPTYQAIRQLLLDQPLRLKMGQAALERVQQDFTWEAIAPRFLEQHLILP
ncbi:glycosyltransferase family 4 protein [Crocosphaera sp.]|uniref:glycosyltransferase family 4 protein n=1 Tax=Crocosphaera sp. TaxID=2729996 RepID=UPI002630B5D5|nr:glycosyltransferase family 4 protein [Crocosphaera sp.]MDJ0581314.1 glycosyltransferase family 4 protein [Crocosphaera sp.]